MACGLGVCSCDCRGVRVWYSSYAIDATRATVLLDGVHACHPHAIEETTIRTPKRTLGTCAAWARRTAGYILKTKAIFSGDSEKVTVRPVDSPSRGASTSNSFDGALIAFSAAGARRPVAAAQNASSSTAPVTTSSLWRFCRASSLWSSFARRITSALLAVGRSLLGSTGWCSPLRRRRLIHAVIANFASQSVA